MTFRWVGWERRWSSQNPQTEGLSQPRRPSLRSERSEPHVRVPSLGDLHQKDKPPTQCVTVKTNGAQVQESQTAERNWDSSLKRLTHNSFTPSPRVKAEVWKAPGSQKKEIHWQILGRVQDLVELPLGTEALMGAISFLLSFHLVGPVLAGAISVTLHQPG